MRGFGWCLAAVVLLLSAADVGYGFPNDKGGFRGIPWGDPLPPGSGLRFYRAESEMGVPAGRDAVEPLHAYSKDGDDLFLGKAELSVVYYYFWRGRFFGMSAATKSMRSKDALKEVCFERFGTPDRTEKFVMPGVRYAWVGEGTVVFLEDFAWYWRITMVSREMAAAREESKTAARPEVGRPDAGRGF